MKPAAKELSHVMPRIATHIETSHLTLLPQAHGRLLLFSVCEEPASYPERRCKVRSETSVKSVSCKHVLRSQAPSSEKLAKPWRTLRNLLQLLLIMIDFRI